jgi:hypothetical protein
LTVADRLSALTPEQRALFEALRRKRQAAITPQAPQPPPVPRVTSNTAAGDWPLAIDQERLWRLHRENPGLVSWNVDAATRLRGDLDAAILEAALREVVRRHAALRACFPLVDGRPVQRVAERMTTWRPCPPCRRPCGRTKGIAPCSTARGECSTWSTDR